MHEYISKFSDLVEHGYTLTPGDPASMILASDFVEGIMNPYIKNKLISSKLLQSYKTFLNLQLRRIKNKRSGLWTLKPSLMQ